MGNYEFTSWAIHMIMLVLFSNLVAVVVPRMEGLPRREPARPSPWGCLVLTAAILLITYGNYLGDQGVPA